MKFSVIVPSYRRPNSLRRCVSAILAGTRLPDELVVVVRDTDLGSRAAVDEMATGDRAKTVRTAVVHEPGQIAAINRGVAASSGDIVVFTDDDTEPTRDWLARLAVLYDDPAVVGAGGRDRVAEAADEGPAAQVGRLTWYGRLIGNHHRGCDGVQRVQHLKGANMSFRRSVLPPFDPNLFRAASMQNDTDVSLGAGRHGVLLYDPEAVVDHHAAERGMGVSRDNNDPVVVRADSHNWVYCVLKHLRPWAKPIFMLYALGVGRGACLGPVRWLWQLLKGEGRPLRQLWAATLGKLNGLRTYLASQGGRVPLPPPEAGNVP